MIGRRSFPFKLASLPHFWTRQGEPRVAEILRSARWRWWGRRGNFSTGELLFSSKFRHPLRRSRSWWHLVVEVFLPNIHFIVFSMCFVFFAFCSSGHFPTKCIAFNPTQGNSDYKFVQFRFAIPRCCITKKHPCFFLLGVAGDRFSLLKMGGGLVSDPSQRWKSAAATRTLPGQVESLINLTFKVIQTSKSHHLRFFFRVALGKKQLDKFGFWLVNIFKMFMIRVQWSQRFEWYLRLEPAESTGFQPTFWGVYLAHWALHLFFWDFLSVNTWSCASAIFENEPDTIETNNLAKMAFLSGRMFSISSELTLGWTRCIFCP